MEKNKHDKAGSSAFFWGLVIGALLATLITTRRGRLILRELTDLGLELIENFIEERTKKNESKTEDKFEDEVSENEEIIRATEDLESEIVEDEPEHPKHKVVREISFDENIEETPKSSVNGNGKKRLFRGIRRK